MTILPNDFYDGLFLLLIVLMACATGLHIYKLTRDRGDIYADEEPPEDLGPRPEDDLGVYFDLIGIKFTDPTDPKNRTG